MKIDILDKKINENNSWFLGKISLWDYLSSVKPENFEFDIQRGIVRNKYLDSILKSINDGEIIPPITITTDKYINIKELSQIDIEDGKFNILDGLQRTYRLWLYKKIAEISEQNKDMFGNYTIKDIISILKDKPYCIPGVITVSQIEILLNKENLVNISKIDKIYKNFSLYIYGWIGLTEKETIQKMLILNAGQRMVSINHQYELMFLQIFKNKELPNNVTLIREKQGNYTTIKMGNREVGEFIFSSTIIGIQSLISGKPIRLSVDNLELGVDDNYISEEDLSQYFNQPFLNIYLKSLYELDIALYNKDINYLKWFVKDTTISGIMGAIGESLKLTKEDYEQQFKIKIDFLIDKIKNNNSFELDQFYKFYNTLSSQKINIGDKVRKAIYEYTLGVLNNTAIKWSDAFTNNMD